MLTLDDDYRELIQQAHDAIRDLLDESDHAACMHLRYGYRELREALERDDRNREGDARERRARERQATLVVLREGQRVWHETPRERRESLLFHALGDGRLILRELTARINAALGYPKEGSKPAVYQNEIRYLAEKMLRAGQLERTPEPLKTGGGFRYRYSRKRTLDGPIKGLERAYHDDQEGGL